MDKETIKKPKDSKKPKERKPLKPKQKKAIKWAAAGTVGLSSGLILTIFSYDPSAFGGTSDAVAGFWTGFILGFLFILWYPATRILAWMKTRTLKNKSLEKEIELKDAKIEYLANKTTPKSMEDIEG